MRVFLDDVTPNRNDPPKRNFYFSGTTTIDNVQIIRKVIIESQYDGITRETAENILQYQPEKNWSAEIYAIFRYVLRNMKYMRDMAGVEMVKTPAVHLADIYGPRGMAFGDCDDHVTLLGALLYNAGYENIRLVIMRSIGVNDGYNHIYLQVMIPDTREWLSLDATEKDQPGGWEPQSVDRKYFNI